MRALAICVLALLGTGCGGPPPSDPASAPDTSALRDFPLAAPQRELSQPTPAPRNVWSADIRSDVAFLNFGYPNSDYLAFRLQCAPASGHAVISMPSVGATTLEFASGDVRDAFPL